jgi:hypothetical protein
MTGPEKLVIFREFKPCAQHRHRAKDAVYGWTQPNFF